MAFFDKLKDKVNKYVDTDKLSEMANKTVASVKQEVAKVIDPNIKEQERLAKEKALQEQKEQEKQEKERAIANFFSSIELDKELDYIFAVLEKSEVSVSNFEKGVEHMLSKAGTTITKAEALPTIKKELFNRVFADTDNSITRVVAINYFLREVIDDKLFYKYSFFAICREKGYSLSNGEEPFVKALYGIAGHVVNYLQNEFGPDNYVPVTQDDFIPIIENSDVLKSYTDADPFTADEVRKKWAQELCDSPLEIVRSSSLSSLLDEEGYVDKLYYLAYIILCKKQEVTFDNVSVSSVSSVYLEHLKEYYNRIKSY